MILILICLGLLVGSFLNVVIHRGPVIWGLVAQRSPVKRLGFAAPRSHCPACHTVLTTKDLFPVLSFLYLKGHCRYCAARISSRYPLIELLGALSALISVNRYGISWEAAYVFSFFCFLICLSVIDIETFFLPDALTLPLLAAGLVINFFSVFVSFPEAAIGSLAGFILFWLVGVIFTRLTAKEGLGLGDAKLLAACGGWLGWMVLPVLILIASLSALWTLLALYALKRRRDLTSPLPFGPFLALAGAICMVIS